MPQRDRRPIQGGYFPYCRFCVHDGACELKHHEFLGMPQGKGVDSAAYGGHENLQWSHMAFQHGLVRGTCTGRIQATGSIFYPLQCECGSVVPSLGFFHKGCGKLAPNEKGKERLELARRLAEEQGVSPEEAKLPPIDEDYEAEMRL